MRMKMKHVNVWQIEANALNKSVQTLNLITDRLIVSLKLSKLIISLLWNGTTVSGFVEICFVFLKHLSSRDVFYSFIVCIDTEE